MADLFEDYRLGPAWDEMFAEAGVPRNGAACRPESPSVSAPWRLFSPTGMARVTFFPDGVVPRRVVVTSRHFHREAVA